MLSVAKQVCKSLSRGYRKLMPKQSKVSPAERRGWLERYEDGQRLDKLAKDSRRDPRTISMHIEKARLERDFVAAQSEQLRGALQAHQRDMLAALDQLSRAIHVLPLNFLDPTGLDFGFEDLWEPSELARYKDLPLDPAAAAKITRDQNGPLEVILAVEETRLWPAIKEHIRKDQLWRHLADWRQALLQECRLRADLNLSIRRRAEAVFGLTVSRKSADGKPWLSAAAVWWMRARLTNSGLGEYVPSVEEDVRQTSTGALESKSGQWLADHLEDTDKAVVHLGETIAGLNGSEEVQAAARNFANLRDLTSRVYAALEEYALIHHIPGRCSLCRKLGGQ